jgi:hypothetical protein
VCWEGGAEVSCVPDCCFARRGACRVFGAACLRRRSCPRRSRRPASYTGPRRRSVERRAGRGRLLACGALASGVALRARTSFAKDSRQRGAVGYLEAGALAAAARTEVGALGVLIRSRVPCVLVIAALLLEVRAPRAANPRRRGARSARARFVNPIEPVHCPAASGRI